MKKRLPNLKSDRAMARFLESDLSQYLDADNLFPATFEFAPKAKVVNLRMSEGLLSAVKNASRKRGIPYQRYIREALEQILKKEIGSQTGKKAA
jgi:predicted DNA binding CopG/RHH family protein